MLPARALFGASPGSAAVRGGEIRAGGGAVMRLCEGSGDGGAGPRGRVVPGRAPQVSAEGRGPARPSHRPGRPGAQRRAGTGLPGLPGLPAASGLRSAAARVGLSARRVSSSSSPSRLLSVIKGGGSPRLLRSPYPLLYYVPSVVPYGAGLLACCLPCPPARSK